MAIHGGMAGFDSATEEWQAYEERLNQYFIANDVQDAAIDITHMCYIYDAAKQRASLFSVFGPKRTK